MTTLLAIALMCTTGHGLLRWISGDWPLAVFGPVAAVGLSTLLGGAAIGLYTSYVAIAGLSTRAWPIVIALSLLGVLPVSAARRLRIHRGQSRTRIEHMWFSDAVVAALVAIVGVVMLTGFGRAIVVNNDEYAIWAVRGRTLSLAGHLDPHVFLGVSANYQHPDYPLLVPALIGWADTVSGRLNDPAAHAVLISLFLALLVVTGWAISRLAGPLAGVAAVLLVVGTPRVLSRWAMLLMADVPLVDFTIALVVVLALWLMVKDARLLGVAAVLGMAAASAKVEGLPFVVAILAAAFVSVRRVKRERRQIAVTLGVVVLSALPWLAWTRLHHLQSDQINAATLRPSHLRTVAPYWRLCIQLMAHYWPGYGWIFVLAAVIAGALLLPTVAGRGMVAFIGLAWAFTSLGMWAQYVISAAQPGSTTPIAVGLRGHFASSATRVLLVPAIVLTLAAPLFAGCVLSRRWRAAGPPQSRTPHATLPASQASG
jgi:hypothetical protein